MFSALPCLSSPRCRYVRSKRDAPRLSAPLARLLEAGVEQVERTAPGSMAERVEGVMHRIHCNRRADRKNSATAELKRKPGVPLDILGENRHPEAVAEPRPKGTDEVVRLRNRRVLRTK